ncbi:Conserved hypothetical protein [Yarrowia lipolytica]|nr:Conserved hypothetical protein [Yarrowia lipolytica]
MSNWYEEPKIPARNFKIGFYSFIGFIGSIYLVKNTSGPKKPSPTLETSSKSRTASCLPETRSPQALPASSECPTTRALVTLTWARRWVTGSVCLPRVPPNPSPIPSLTTTNKRINRFPSSCPNPTDPFGHFCT